ncbi:hypothetical protein BBO99_00001086 [Phytophthora kernoviae]|uniref:Uncharacterized protein n=1 Tax=Phytophthora kernoviae TaxID=325452 RepID=A0A3R7JSD4_9STRA|nr:hypothetical protein BBI17_001057 [Phytophthora kernoviae]RLN84747.1 hypothetical protein BBO99_00001086 [Phytophthora kernoviae]
MKGAARQLAAAVEAIRAGGGTAAEQQTQQRELIQALFALQRLWTPELLTNPTPAKKRSSKSNAALFQLLLATLIVYSGGNTNSSGSGAAGAGAGAMGVSLSSSSVNTSECIHRLVCDLLVRSFDYSVVPTINENLLSKNMSLYIKVSLVMVVCRLSLQDAMQFLPDVVTLISKNIRAADYYLKQCLLESVAHALEGNSLRLVPFHAEALKIVVKTCQDKVPEVRIAAAKLLQVVAECTSVSTNAAAGSGSSGAGSQGSNGNGSGSGALGSGGVSAVTSSGGGSNHGGTLGVSLDAILQITAKGMDDDSPEARRTYSVVVGTVLAKYATSSSGETEIQVGGGESNSASTDEDTGGRHSMEQDGAPGKSKLAFKLHVPGMSTISLPLSRRKAAMVNFSTIPNVVLYFKDMVTSKYLSSNPNQSHGGILSSFSIALCSMFERLPPDSIAESQLHEVVDATLAILDHPFALGDLTRARNAVGFVLRYGINVCLTERQQEALLGAYLQKLKDESKAPEPNHHKTLSVLVELSHMFHSMGEAAGRSTAIAHVLRAIKLENKGGLSQAVMDDIYTISEELVESQFLSECADSVWLTCTRAGWTLVGSLVAMNDEQWTYNYGAFSIMLEC